MLSNIQQGGKPVLRYHGYSLGTALSDLFPNIGIDRSKFQFLSREFYYYYLFVNTNFFSPIDYWEKPEYRRKFFIDFAKENNFDPLVAKNWYLVHRSQLASIKVVCLFVV